ncbi:hypothetical protein [Acetomicrobium sp. S15 = DSM 107314]
MGIDITLGIPRFTFGSSELLGGVNFIPAMSLSTLHYLRET